MKHSIFLRIFLVYAAIIFFLAGAVAVLAPGPMKRHHIGEQATHLEHLAALIEGPVIASLGGNGAGSLEDFVKDIGRKTSTRVTVIRPDGTVLADSEKDPREMENHLYRPEVFAALRGETQTSIRPSSTLKRDMMYMGFPLRSDGRIIGALRLSLFMTDLDLLFGRLRADLLRILGLVTLVALGAALFFSRSISRPLREFIDASARVAGGDFGTKVSLRQQGEFKKYALSFNAMTENLQAMFQQIRLQTEELNSVLASITDGLCVLDASGRIVLCNDGFRKIAGSGPAEGKYYWEVIRSSKLAEVIKGSTGARRTAAEEIGLGDRVFASSITPLVFDDRFVVMLRDITEFRRLEKVKKDFVVNVSHELKTPLAAIKGFVETMEPSIGADNRAYLEIVKRNTDRLIAIVEDLIVLSRLEDQGMAVHKEKVDVRGLAGNVLKLFEKASADKGLAVAVEAGSELPPVNADPYEIERLLINLLDNAVKYTDRGRIVLRLASDGKTLTIEVSDTGIGIEADDLPHIYERFYVVDKSRSKKLGGTGLGLSIVKHIVQVHRGAISVKSRPGEGTTFTVSLPVS
jgi:two-component system, OmpR family, phosphate regulon sensor histidine kinase PhoR